MPYRLVPCEFGTREPVICDHVPIPMARKHVAYATIPEGLVNCEPVDGPVTPDTCDPEAVQYDVLTCGVETCCSTCSDSRYF